MNARKNVLNGNKQKKRNEEECPLCEANNDAFPMKFDRKYRNRTENQYTHRGNSHESQQTY